MLCFLTRALMTASLQGQGLELTKILSCWNSLVSSYLKGWPRGPGVEAEELSKRPVSFWLEQLSSSPIAPAPRVCDAKSAARLRIPEATPDYPRAAPKQHCPASG